MSNRLNFHIGQFGRVSRIFLATLLTLTGLATQAHSQTDSVRLSSIGYTTNNLDSLTRHFTKLGLKVASTDMRYGGWVQSTIELPSGQHILLVAPPKSEALFSVVPTLQRNTTAINNILFTSTDLERLRIAFDSAGIDYVYDKSDANHQRLVLRTFGPIEIAIENSAITTPARSSSQGISRITWLVLTAGAAEEKYLRKVFEVLQFRKLHEGCCDYWLIGSANDRIGMRFEIPNPAVKRPDDWLSIEDGGLILNY